MNSLRAELQLEEEILFGLKPAVKPGSKDELKLRPSAARGSLAPAPPAPPGLAGLRRQANADAGRRFIALLHFIDVELLKSAYHLLKIESARGGGGHTWMQYGEDLDSNAVRLYTRLQRGQHRTLPSWRKAMAVAQGQRAPLKRAALKDRVVQRATAMVFAAIFEDSFLSFAREDAREQLMEQLDGTRTRWVVEVPIAEFHDAIHRKFLVRSLEQRIGDAVLMTLIGEWLDAGLLDDAAPGEKPPQPFNALACLLTNVYYHYGFDVWAERWRQRHARSSVILTRDREHLLAVFEHKPGARRFQLDLRARLKQFMPSLPPKKVRLSGLARFERQTPALQAQGQAQAAQTTAR